MGHGSDLLEKISGKLRREYPEPPYRYEYEKRIDGTQWEPDILISLICVVEIGYTRPEKLAAYRDELLIDDVRWYSKDGQLHAELPTLTLVDTEIAGSYLGIEPDTLTQWRYQRRGPPYHKLGGAVRYAVRDLEVYVAERRIEPTCDPPQQDDPL